MRAEKSRAPRPRLVEVVGPAGSGKSTLVRSMPARHPARCGWLSLWGLPLPSLLAGAIALVPTALKAALRGRPLRFAELAQMARLEALARRIDRLPPDAPPLVVLDEGPVFGLTWLDVFFGRNGDPGWTAWRRRAVAEWAARLDAVLCLDADDRVLIRRIRERSQDHMVKDRPEPEIRAFTARFRQSYDRVLRDLASSGRPAVLCLRTDDENPDARWVLGALEEALRER
ncbi:MAG: AAA family ATPase [Gemmatimonadales bacterium]